MQAYAVRREAIFSSKSTQKAAAAAAGRAVMALQLSVIALLRTCQSRGLWHNSRRTRQLTGMTWLQDVMRLDNSARMNFPGTVEGNWSWRVGDEKIWGNLAQEAGDLRALCAATDRLPPGEAL